MTLYFVHYNIPATAQAGVVALTFLNMHVAVTANLDEGGSCNPVVSVPAPCIPATVSMYCGVTLADVNHDTIVNSIDLLKTAMKFGVVPPPAGVDQNFDGVVNSADLAAVAQRFNKRTFGCS